MQPLGDLARVKDRLPKYTPLSQTVHTIIVWVSVLVALERGLVIVIQKAVVLISALETHGPGVLPVEEAHLEPVQDRDRVKREHNLLVCPAPTQTHVKLVEVFLQDFRRFLHPDVCKLPFGESN